MKKEVNFGILSIQLLFPCPEYSTSFQNLPRNLLLQSYSLYFIFLLYQRYFACRVKCGVSKLFQIRTRNARYDYSVVSFNHSLSCACSWVCGRLQDGQVSSNSYSTMWMMLVKSRGKTGVRTCEDGSRLEDAHIWAKSSLKLSLASLVFMFYLIFFYL